MKKIKLLLLSAFVLTTNILQAQTINYKEDTILVDNQPYIIMIAGSINMYSIRTIKNKELMTLHSSQIDDKGYPLHIATFLNDSKCASMLKTTRNNDCFAKYLYQFMLIKGNNIDIQNEYHFINTHTLPEGYTDINETIDANTAIYTTIDANNKFRLLAKPHK